MMAALQCLAPCAWHCGFLECMLLTPLCTASSLREGREREREQEDGNLWICMFCTISRADQCFKVDAAHLGHNS